MLCGCEGLILCPGSESINKTGRNWSFWGKVSSGKEKKFTGFALQWFRISSGYREVPVRFFQELLMKSHLLKKRNRTKMIGVLR